MSNAAGFLKLTRLPLVFTAIADSAAGYLLTAREPQALTLALLAGTSACLYACGMVFNDVADALRDRVLHPERPIPSKQVSVLAARRLGLVLMFAAALFGSAINFAAGQVVLLIFILIMAYDFYTKPFPAAGAATMGLIRAANFVLGVIATVPREAGLLVVPAWQAGAYAHAAVLGGYVCFLTLLSTLEDRSPDRPLFVVYALAMAAAPLSALAIARSTASIVAAAALAGLLLAHALASLRSLDRAAVMRNVRWGVLAIVALDASFVMARDWRWGLGLLGLAVPALVLLPLFRRL